MEVDNFKLILDNIEFKEQTDRYVLHILRRPKDCKNDENYLGSNETQRLIRSYYIENKDYLKRKINAIKELCQRNNARCYILPQPRNNRTCMLNLVRNVIDNIDNPTIKPEHLLRQSYCGENSTAGIAKDRKRWILDIDNDEMHGFTHDEIVDIVKQLLRDSQKPDGKMFEVPTCNGFHIVSEPFDTKLAFERCYMMFKDSKKGFDIEKSLNFYEKYGFPSEFSKNMPKNPFLIEKYTIDMLKRMNMDRKIMETMTKECRVEFHGWLHRDGMTLLYRKKD